MQVSKDAVILKNVKESDGNDSLIFNQLSTVQLQPTSDITFDYKGTDSFSIQSTAPVEAIDISLSALQSMQPNQAVNVTATLSMGDSEPKSILIKATSKTLNIKEDCILEDTTGTAELHIWDPLFNELNDGHTYTFKNLAVKHFKGTCHLATKQDTTFCDAEQQIIDVNGHQLLNNPEKELKVENFLLIKNLCVFFSCQNCSKKITDLNSEKVKCSYCKTSQRSSQCKTHASAVIKVKDQDGDTCDMWLTAFTDVLEQLLKVSSTVSLASNIETIEDVLLGLVNIKFV